MSPKKSSKRTPEELSLHQRAAVLSSWSKTADRSARSKPGQDGLWQKFLDEVDPERIHPERVRAQMAEAAFKAHMARLAYRSVRNRRLRALEKREPAKANGKKSPKRSNAAPQGGATDTVVASDRTATAGGRREST